MGTDTEEHNQQRKRKNRKILISILLVCVIAIGAAVTRSLLIPRPTYTNQEAGYILTLPRSFYGNYRVDGHGADVMFYQANATDGAGPLMIVKKTDQDWSTFEENSPVPVSKLAEGNGGVLYIQWPSDVEWNVNSPLRAMEYNWMQSAAKNLGGKDVSFSDSKGS
jgi:hypothetical protein